MTPGLISMAVGSGRGGMRRGLSGRTVGDTTPGVIGVKRLICGRLMSRGLRLIVVEPPGLDMFFWVCLLIVLY